MQRPNKDLFTRLTEVMTAWGNMRPEKKFFGLTLEELKSRSAAFVEARNEIVDLESRTAHAVSKREAAAAGLAELVRGVVDSVKGDPTEGPNGALYSAMGFVPPNKRASGLVRRVKAGPAPPFSVNS